MSEQKIRSIVIDKLKDGYLIRHNNYSYDNCVFIEGFDYNRLATEISKIFNVEASNE